MSRTLFTYGTLEVAEIMEMVTGARFPSEPAVLDGFARFLFRNRSYPGIVAAAGEVTVGTLYQGLDARALALLDEFEGEWYERRPVRVRTMDGTLVSACAYIIPEHYRHVVGTEPWDRKTFLASRGAEYRRRWNSFSAIGRRRQVD
ncbi:MAG: gamma-glutamylcyclotransferase [Deltaproteobacteria bacterium]